jgi:DNA-binding winged helix-turn-helix (wHTH) protein/tetratricopeptide (TPR) repeat protein
VSHVYAFGPFRLDLQNESLSRGSKPIHLTAKAYSVLRLLVEHSERLVPKEEILKLIWPDGFVEPANLTQTVYVLRKALDDRDAKLIETVPGRGYRLAARVERQSLISGAPRSRATPSTQTRAAVHVAWLAGLFLAVGAVGGSDVVANHVPVVSMDPRVQRDYLLGRHYWNERSIPSIKLGLRYFKQALAIDPNNALVHSGLADSYSALAYYSGWDKSRFEMSRAEALKAVALDPQAAEGHASLAFVDSFLGPTYLPEVAREFQRSIALDGRYATAHEWYSWFLFNHGDAKGALVQMARARDLDPTSPIINFALANQLYYLRKYKEASEQWHLGISILPDSEEGYYGAGLSDEQAGDEPRAERELQRALTFAPNDPDVLGALAHVYVRAGQTKKGLALLSRISVMRPAPAYEIALVETALGQQDAAVQWLGVAEKQRDMNLVEFSLDPRMDKLRRNMTRYVARNA